MRIAHIIIAHTNPAQVERLIKRLQHPDADFYIHIDLKADIGVFRSLSALSGVTFIQDRINCNWGGNSLFIGIISALREVLRQEKKYDYFNLLSGQDYPIAPVEDIHRYLTENAGISFISYETSKDSEWLKNVAQRYEKYHFTDLDFKWKYGLQKIINMVAPKRKFPIKTEFYGGNKATWWTVTEACAAYVVEQLDKAAKLTNSLKYSWGTDEFAFCSIIMNSDFKNKAVNNNLRYIDWSEGNANPKLLGMADFENLQRSGMFFARKFDAGKAPDILDKIDQECLNRNKSGL